MRILIVDDEQPARDRLRRLLAAIPNTEVCGEAADGPSALAAAREQQPDVILLDIEMPGLRGTEVAASLPAAKPRVIFCTAYDQYAVEAFALQAADYLLKPVSQERLAAALSRLPAPTPLPPPRRFLARLGDRYRVIPAEDALCFLSAEGATKLVTASTHYWMDPTLNDLESRLDPTAYFRISRAAIIRLDQVREVTPTTGGAGELQLKNNARLEVSRRRFKDLLDRLIR